MSRSVRRLVLLIACTVIMALSFITQAPAQDTGFHSTLSASTTVRLTAVKRGTIGVNFRSVPLAFNVDADQPTSPVSIPISTWWNVSPLEVSGVELIAYFADPDRALVDNYGNAIPSAELLGRLGAGQLLPFNQTNFFGPAGGSLRLFGETISHANARATRNDMLEIQPNPQSVIAHSRSLYSGVLNLEARYF